MCGVDDDDMLVVYWSSTSCLLYAATIKFTFIAVMRFVRDRVGYISGPLYKVQNCCPGSVSNKTNLIYVFELKNTPEKRLPNYER